MGNFLAIDTSSRYLTVLAQNGGKLVKRYSADCAMKHSVLLMDEVDKALCEAGLKVADCDFIAAVTGPGSFTGIRIGVSAAEGFALGADKPLLSVTSFDLIAYNVDDENFCVVIDAARSHYYVCGYGRGKEINLPPSYLSAEQVLSLGRKLYGFEDLPLENYTKLNAGECLENAVKNNTSKPSREMHALYVRKSQAEEARKC
ncbi:MAG: tRNA (adenosine(37)-N6)-threonylcarbamoyltransferase complex dimerization subunit type 1 TsaB [Clostridia bacterium]|nr:tRNA (adenosine(37)-N6)-threonylcarbamoyltransferase complex dimerization subunit type 1 TsaB [Clostridia bacterium]